MPADDNTKYINLDNVSAQHLNMMDKLSDAPYDSEIARVDEEAKIGNLDDHVDITDPDYNEAKTEAIERELAAQDNVEY